ncbi:hypothetical protein EMCG_08053 [[Emmonsia] crescens]|uniref:Uncharacterized protein n=1 Tax=[Emmonsia] crescens TaxID=73230 RepID=A0A0G2I6G5_9EURO|nr:hypothetical protein EMCG_08053 [Emmonsia crescens UAMH 3008]
MPRLTTPSRTLSEEAKSQGSSPARSAPSHKRKQPAMHRYQQALSCAKEFLETNPDIIPPAYKGDFQIATDAGEILRGFKGLKAEPRTLHASFIGQQHINDVAVFFGLDREYHPMSAKAFSLTFIDDLVLFDIRERWQEEFTARNICLIGEHPLPAQSLSSQRVPRIADCVLGYEPPMPTLPRTIESISILIEAKTGSFGRLDKLSHISRLLSSIAAVSCLEDHQHHLWYDLG